MCEHCRNIQTWRKFDAPKDYLACIAYIQQLVEQGEFELIAEESTCPLEKVKNEDGWADEIMAHMIRCKHCGQLRSDLHLCSQHLARQRTLQKRQRMTRKRR